MSRVAYVNGRFRPLAQSRISIEDRGLQFADGAYEVVKVVGGRPVDLDRHLERLDRSLANLRIRWPLSSTSLAIVISELLRRNRLNTALLYLQVGRGAASRNHLFPPSARPSLVATVRRAHYPKKAELELGVAVVTMPDERWARCDIKSVSLLPNVLARQRAAEAGCREAWLLDEQGNVTEGTSSNAYIVDREGRLVTRPLGPEILGGITRAVVLELAAALGIAVEERRFSREEALAAREAFLTSTSSLVLPVTVIDGQTIANGRPGSITRRLLTALVERSGIPRSIML